MERGAGALEALVTPSPPLDPQFWHGRRVFLTGHTGFKGSWLCLLLRDLGAEVHGFALEPDQGAIFEAANVRRALHGHVIADICDLAAVKAAMADAKPSVVLHLAAQALVRLSYREPVSTYATNVMGTVNVLEAVRSIGGVDAAVVVTSDKCYENFGWPWSYRETDPFGGHDPYSNSKGCAELVAAAYRRSFLAERGVKVASARAGNVVGGGDRALDRLVPDLIAAASAGRETLIRNPQAVRPWQHVMEPLSGYVQLAQKLVHGQDGSSFAEGWNFGPSGEAERTVADVADAVCRHWGATAKWVRDQDPQPHEAHFLKLESSKARQVMGWRSVWSFDDTIRETVSWYRAAADGEQMPAFTERQIASYVAALNGATHPERALLCK